MSNVRLFSPILLCTKKTGPGEVSLIKIAVSSRRGAMAISSISDSEKSRIRFITMGRPCSLPPYWVIKGEPSNSSIIGTLSFKLKRSESTRMIMPCCSHIAAISDAWS